MTAIWAGVYWRSLCWSNKQCRCTRAVHQCASDKAWVCKETFNHLVQWCTKKKAKLWVQWSILWCVSNNYFEFCIIWSIHLYRAKHLHSTLPSLDIVLSKHHALLCISINIIQLWNWPLGSKSRGRLCLPRIMPSVPNKLSRRCKTNKWTDNTRYTETTVNLVNCQARPLAHGVNSVCVLKFGKSGSSHMSQWSRVFLASHDIQGIMEYTGSRLIVAFCSTFYTWPDQTPFHLDLIRENCTKQPLKWLALWLLLIGLTTYEQLSLKVYKL